MAENPLTAGDIRYYPSSQLQRTSVAENPFTAGDIHSYPSSQPQRALAAETLLPLGIFTRIYHSSNRGPQR